MAVLSGANAVTVYQSGFADKVALIALRNVTTGDTLDVGGSGINILQVVNRAVVIGITVFVEIAASWSGTVVTMPTGLSADAAYLLAWGSGVG
jgi:hypothetical protein